MENVNKNMFWKKSPSERLSLWRKFRKNNDFSDIKNTCDVVWSLWIMAPTVNINIDPYDLTRWPTLWEMIQEGTCCKFSRALGAAYTIYYLNNSVSIKIARVYDQEKNDIYTTAIINDMYMLAENSIEVEFWNDKKEKIQIEEIWDIKEIIDKVLYKAH